MSLSATVVTLGAAQVQGDASLAEGIANHGELLGMPVGTPWTKRYAFGLIPIGDAFVAWSKTARPWVAKTPAPPRARLSFWWRVPLLSLLLVVGAAPWLPALLRRLPHHRHRNRPPTVPVPRILASAPGEDRLPAPR